MAGVRYDEILERAMVHGAYTPHSMYILGSRKTGFGFNFWGFRMAGLFSLTFIFPYRRRSTWLISPLSRSQAPM